MKKTIGILGGMGPMATCDMFQKIIELTPAKADQDHFHIIIDSDPTIPNRVDAILGSGENAAPCLIESAKRLQNAGASLLIMPCNTAHYYYDEINSVIDIPFIHMPECTVKELHRRNIKKAGLLATWATLKTGIYDAPFAKYGIEMATLNTEGQELLTNHIFNGIKAGILKQDIRGLKTHLLAMLDSGVECFVLACTEVPLLFAHNDFGLPVLDATMVLAKEAVRQASAPV